ncbi:hypothetical protein [Mycobacterium sp. SMC-4]|uniref:hypothetical protein n=1 Tax=Mycobacterium sp. SMC-4 TaxID=2857059 RepID=UPI003CFF7803
MPPRELGRRPESTRGTSTIRTSGERHRRIAVALKTTVDYLFSFAASRGRATRDGLKHFS